MLRELAQLLAEEGIDVDSIDVPGLDTLQRPLNRAVERRNMELFSPVGQTRDIALITLRLVVEAILAATLLDQVQPESPYNSTATVASCIGIALGLLDNWMCGQARDAPTKLGHHTTLPDTLFLARKARAFRSLDKLLTRQGGPQVLAGSALALALALATATDAWAQRSDTSHAKLIPTIVR